MPEIKPSKEKLMNAFVEQLIKDKGWAERSPEEILELTFELKTQAEGEVDHAVLEALSDQKLIELDEKMQAGMTDDEIEEFFDQAGIDYFKVIGETLAGFRQKVLNDKVGE